VAFSEILDEPIALPCHGIYVHWGFSSRHHCLEWEIAVRTDPGTSVGEYLALFNGDIDGAQCYLGLQTNVSHPDRGRRIGKGLIFSTWWTFDGADTRIATDGFRELGTHEGRFVGVRRPYAWAVGSYRVRLARSEPDLVAGRETDWFDLWIMPVEPAPVIPPGHGRSSARPGVTGPMEWVGGLRFPRRSRGEPATIGSGGVTFFEVYSGAATWADVAPWHVGVMAYGDGERCPAGRTEYPRYPHDQLMPNANVRYDPLTGLVELAAGSGVVQREGPSRWP